MPFPTDCDSSPSTSCCSSSTAAFFWIHRDESKPSGCLIINDLSTPPTQVAADRYLEVIRDGTRSAIRRSNVVDGTDPRYNAIREESLVAAVIGVNVSHHHDAIGTAKMVDGIRLLVRCWA